jgi:hypothetical protein
MLVHGIFLRRQSGWILPAESRGGVAGISGALICYSNSVLSSSRSLINLSFNFLCVVQIRDLFCLAAH